MPSPADLRGLAPQVERRLAALDAAKVPSRIWARDPTVWKPDPNTPEIRDRLGWLTVVDTMRADLPRLRGFAEQVRGAFRRVVLCGMGGSSLAPEVLRLSGRPAAGYPTLHVLDSTDPGAVAAAGAGGVGQTLFLISSKSGTTLEPDCFYRHFWELAGQRGAQFAAITDPGTPLARLAAERRFRETFLNPADIGGRYSALSYFGLVPAALLGLDVGRLLDRATRMITACGPGVAARDNPGAWLGAVLGEAALSGRDKATILASPGIASYGLWAEQLIAESTGKEGTGILPVAGEPLGPPEVYGSDRVFIAMSLSDERDPVTDAGLAALGAAGHPVVRLVLADPDDLGAEFFRWEFATAVAGAILGINAFDQPNVAESKANTEAVLTKGAPPRPLADKDALGRFVAQVRPGDYVALLAYLPPTSEHDRRLAAVRLALRNRLRVATTLGYGPRYLHSTGQLHKGGPPRGHFLEITALPATDLPIPGKPFTFGQFEAAQAEGDLQALDRRGRPALQLRLDLLER